MDAAALVNGRKIAYTLTGSGRPAVLLHGWMCNRHFWKEQIRLLSDSHQVLAPDFCGHGDSDVDAAGCTMEQLARDVYGLTETLGIEQTVMVGHSMGGMVAQQFCIQHPERVSALVLVTTIAADVEDRLISKRIASEAGQTGFRDAFLRQFDGWFGPETDPGLMRWARVEMLRTPEVVGLSLVLSYRRFDLRAHLPGIRIPTLVICGGSDASAVPDESRALVDLIPGAQMVLMECGHFPMLEEPKTFNRIVDDFLAAQDC